MPGAPVRPTSAQIDRDIIAVAGGIFARHGYERTSLQQLADAVGYSKTGLLHRFGSKEGLHAAVVDSLTEAIEALLARLAEVPPPGTRTVTALRLLTAAALERPGLVRFFVEAGGPSSPDPRAGEVRALGDRFTAALGLDDATPQRRLRVSLALCLVVDAVLLEPDGLAGDLEPLVVELAGMVAGPEG